MADAKREVEVTLTVAELAAAFAERSDEEQAEFFDRVAKIAEGWEKPSCFQWQNIGDALRENGTADGRQMLLDIVTALQWKQEGLDRPAFEDAVRADERNLVRSRIKALLRDCVEGCSELARGGQTGIYRALNAVGGEKADG